MKRFTYFISLVAILSLILNAVLLYKIYHPEKTTYSVLEIIDGDTFKIKVGKETRRVRLMGVDTPEIGKCLGKEAKDKLSELILNKNVALEDQFSDPYGRIMANVDENGKYVNSEILASGLARMDYYENPHREELKKFIFFPHVKAIPR